MKLFFLLALAGAAFAADRFPNAAADSKLPRGDGLAAKLKGDASATAHPAVIFADNFEDGELGTRWDEKGAGKGKALSFAPADAAECGKRCMKAASAQMSSSCNCVPHAGMPLIRMPCRVIQTSSRTRQLCTASTSGAGKGCMAMPMGAGAMPGAPWHCFRW